jgi:archaellum component FlaF (FlaF/FlaG flagellin family)
LIEVPLKPTFVIGMCLGVSLTLVAQTNPPGSARIVENYGKLPLAFEANQGQSDPQVKFLSRGAGYSLFLTSTDAVLTLRQTAEQKADVPGAKAPSPPDKASRESKSAVLRMKLVGSNPKTEVNGQGELPGKSNYFIGNDPKKWHTNVRQFSKLHYENVYPGVDLVYYGRQRELEYDFVLQPGASPQAIRLGIEGAKRLRLVRGDLVMTSAAGDVHLRSPHIYQEAHGVRRDVRGGYVIKGKGEVGFEVAAYDRRRVLVIDPVLAYSTYLGGSLPNNDNGYSFGYGIAVDGVGNAYVTGETDFTDFPTVNPIQPTNHGGGYDNAFVTKFNSDGTALVYSTYLGGSNANTDCYGIAVDTGGNAYVTGGTSSTDFPIANAIQSTNHGGSDAIVTKINAAGNALVYSTYLGGSADDTGKGIAVDTGGNVYVTGGTSSTDFPIANAIQSKNHGGSDAFVTKLNAGGIALVYSTYLGGNSDDYGSGVAVDSTGRAYITGQTSSTNFPTKNAIQPAYGGGEDDAFVTKINAAGTGFVYSTYLGGSGLDAWGPVGIAVDTGGNAYVTGLTESPDFPTANAIQPTLNGTNDAYVTKINANGSALVYSTFLGGSSGDNGSAIAVDAAGDAYVTGDTGSSDFPTKNAIQPTRNGDVDVFVTKFNADGSALVYSTYLGGSYGAEGFGVALDAAGSAYLTGFTSAGARTPFPTTALGFQQSIKGVYDVFVTKIAAQTFVSLSKPKLTFPTQVIGTTSAMKTITVTNQGSGNLTINKIYIGGLNSGDFAETNNCGTTLAPSASCTISVAFTPTAIKMRKAGLGISSSDPASPDAIPLNGIGTAVSLSKSKLSFGDQAVGTTSPPQSVTLTNVGSTQLNFTGISITGTNAGDFSETNTCGASILGKASCTITVKFKPTAVGARNARVSIADDGGGSPQRVALAGTGT